MKNNSLYYTPSLAEFNDGFIFELKLGKTWVPCCFHSDLSNFTIKTISGEIINNNNIELKNVRVKCLSKECLLSKGFQQRDANTFVKIHPSIKINKMVEILLKPNKKISIYLQGVLKVDTIDIKNIYELINLLKKLELHE